MLFELFKHVNKTAVLVIKAVVFLNFREKKVEVADFNVKKKRLKTFLIVDLLKWLLGIIQLSRYYKKV